MELKLCEYDDINDFRILLIVPYGIETKYRNEGHPACFLLLIVPYGIETSLIPYISFTVPLAFNRTLWN